MTDTASESIRQIRDMAVEMGWITQEKYESYFKTLGEEVKYK